MTSAPVRGGPASSMPKAPCRSGAVQAIESVPGSPVPSRAPDPTEDTPRLARVTRGLPERAVSAPLAVAAPRRRSRLPHRATPDLGPLPSERCPGPRHGPEKRQPAATRPTRRAATAITQCPRPPTAPAPAPPPAPAPAPAPDRNHRPPAWPSRNLDEGTALPSKPGRPAVARLYAGFAIHPPPVTPVAATTLGLRPPGSCAGLPVP